MQIIIMFPFFLANGPGLVRLKISVLELSLCSMHRLPFMKLVLSYHPLLENSISTVFHYHNASLLYGVLNVMYWFRFSQHKPYFTFIWTSSGGIILIHTFPLNDWMNLLTLMIFKGIRFDYILLRGLGVSWHITYLGRLVFLRFSIILSYG